MFQQWQWQRQRVLIMPMSCFSDRLNLCDDVTLSELRSSEQTELDNLDAVFGCVGQQLRNCFIELFVLFIIRSKIKDCMSCFELPSCSDRASREQDRSRTLKIRLTHGKPRVIGSSCRQRLLRTLFMPSSTHHRRAPVSDDILNLTHASTDTNIHTYIYINIHVIPCRRIIYLD